jgi:hypothetical protein
MESGPLLTGQGLCSSSVLCTTVDRKERLKPEFQSLNLAGYGLNGLNPATETPASGVPILNAGGLSTQ